MQTCDAFEEALGMRRHGALPPEREEALAKHLVECSSCRAFDEITKGTETLMAQQASMHAQTIDWDELFHRMKRSLARRAREQVTLGALVSIAVVPAVMLMGAPLVVGLKALAAGLLVTLALLWRSRRTMQRAAREQGAGELLFLYRHELEAQLARITRLPWVFPLVVSFEYWIMRARLVSVHAWLGFGGIVALAAVSVGYQVLLRRRRLRAEIDALKADTARA